MATNQCVIDDTYCLSMGNYCKVQGERIEKMLEDYLAVLNTVRAGAIMKGQVHEVLDAYIEYAQKMKGNVGLLSQNAQAQITKFLNKVDETDQYLF